MNTEASKIIKMIIYLFTVDVTCLLSMGYV